MLVGRRPGRARLGLERPARRSRSRARQPRQLGNVLYYLPARLAISGATTFRSDLLRSTVVASDAAVFNKDPSIDQLRPGLGHARLPADRFEGASTPTELAIGLNFGEHGLSRLDPKPVEPLAVDPTGLRAVVDATIAGRPRVDGLPEVELFDIDARRLEAPAALRRRDPVRRRLDPARYVDPTTGPSWSGSSTT